MSLSHKNTYLFRAIAWFVNIAFGLSLVAPAQLGHAQNLALPSLGTIVTASPSFVPPLLKGMIIDTQHPFQFEFIVDSGSQEIDQQTLKTESTKLIKSFL